MRSPTRKTFRRLSWTRTSLLARTGPTSSERLRRATWRGAGMTKGREGDGEYYATQLVVVILITTQNLETKYRNLKTTTYDNRPILSPQRPRPAGPRPRQGRPQQQQEAPQVSQERTPRPLRQEEEGVEFGKQAPQVAQEGATMIFKSAFL